MRSLDRDLYRAVLPPVEALVCAPRFVELCRGGAVEGLLDTDKRGLVLPLGGFVPRWGHGGVTGDDLVGAVGVVADAGDAGVVHVQSLLSGWKTDLTSHMKPC